MASFRQHESGYFNLLLHSTSKPKLLNKTSMLNQQFNPDVGTSAILRFRRNRVEKCFLPLVKYIQRNHLQIPVALRFEDNLCNLKFETCKVHFYGESINHLE